MKLHQIFTFLLPLLLIGTIHAQGNKTTIIGTVEDWPTDTIYLQTMPFHSPHSSELKFQTISKDSTFNFEFKNSAKAFIIQLYSNKKQAENNKQQLLFLNLTKDYFYGHCNKFYTHGIATFLLEPNKTLDVVLRYDHYVKQLTEHTAKKYKANGIEVLKDNKMHVTAKMNIKFKYPNYFQDKYYQTSFNLDDKIDKRLDIYKTRSIETAVISFNKIKKKLLDNLELDKNKLSPILYDYIKAEIEFGARKEFLKFMMLSKEKEMEDFFSKDIPKEVMDIIEFDKTKINATTLISEEYNKFLILYLNFKVNIINKEYNRDYKFGFDKIRTAIRNFPKKSVYFYLANNLLQTNREQLIKEIKNEEAVEEIITKTISKYPDGELNDKLIEKYDL